MDDLITFLRAQLDEDERIARAAAALQADPENGWGISDRAITPHIGIVHEDEARAHIARHNPARVLREIDAKRQLLDKYAEVAANDVNEVEYAHGYANALGEAVRLLALPYADRPGYAEAIARTL